MIYKTFTKPTYLKTHLSVFCLSLDFKSSIPILYYHSAQMDTIIMPVFYEFSKVDRAIVHQECLPNMILLFRSKHNTA